MSIIVSMEAKWPSKVGGDPRKAEAVVKYKRPPLREEDQDPDLRSIASLGLGLAGLFTKVSSTKQTQTETK